MCRSGGTCKHERVSVSVNVTLRPLAREGVAALVDLWNQVLKNDPISVRVFTRQTMGDPNFSPENCTLAETDGRPVGFALTCSPGHEYLHAPPAGVGRVSGLGVLPEYRRSGIGSALLERALGFLKGRGCGRVIFAAHEYYVAGIDRDAYSEGLAFLSARGFAEAGEAIAMGRRLYELEWPTEVRETEERLRGEGVEVRAMQSGDGDDLMDFFSAEFPSWSAFFSRKRADDDPLDDIVIARAGSAVIGYCQRLEADHVGPFGVAEAWRSRGVGSVMLYRLLERMRQKGYRFAWFGETGRARPYYERAGFEVTRRYAIMVRKMDGEEKHG